MRALGVLVLIASLAVSSLAQEDPPRPDIVGIAHVVVLVSDLEEAKRFYGGTLGLRSEKVGDKTRFHLSPQQYIEVEEQGGAAPANRIARVAFATTDLPALYAWLKSRGVNVVALAAVKDGPQPAWLRVRDPLGHEIEFVQQAPAPARQPASARAVGTRLIHAGFVVRDRAAADGFYRDLLGFRLYWQGGMQDAQTDWVDLQVPEGADWLEYMLNISSDASARVLGIMNHIAIGVESMPQAVERLRANGWKENESEKPQVGRDGKWQLNLYDPDLTRVEVMEFRPTQPPCCAEYTGPHPR